jgi:hypothetical protein
MVLDTDAVDVDAQGDRAIAQAVGAAAELLHLLAKRGGCPRCPIPAPPRREERTNGGGV